jgi:hypothetical protein
MTWVLLGVEENLKKLLEIYKVICGTESSKRMCLESTKHTMVMPQQHFMHAIVKYNNSKVSSTLKIIFSVCGNGKCFSINIFSRPQAINLKILLPFSPFSVWKFFDFQFFTR